MQRGTEKRKRVIGEGIFNISNVELTKEEPQVLDLGLKYAPDKIIDKFETYIDLHKFARRVNIKKHFAIQKKSNQKENPDDEPEGYQHSALKNKSTFNLKPTGHHYVEVVKSMVENDIKHKQDKKSKKKINIEKGMRSLEKKKGHCHPLCGQGGWSGYPE